MSLSLDLAAALLPLVGQSYVPARAVAVSDQRGTTIRVAVLSVEHLGVACEELRLTVPQLTLTTIDVLKAWAQGLCQRITYLLETLQPLEFDAQGNQALIRSSQPDQTTQPGQSRYYEVVLSAHGAGEFSLQRYVSQPGQPGRTRVPLQLTHELLAKLVNDLMATLPGGRP